jgi:hypothetical protein
MPSPVLHAFAGYSIYKYSLQEGQEKSWKMASLFIFLANLADLDMLPGMFFGNPNMFHRSHTHSLLAALLCSLAVAGLARFWKKMSFFKMFWIALAAYFSHVLLDALTGSVKFAFWPLQISIQPMPLAQLMEHAHPAIPCESLGQFCQLLISSTFVVRLGAEALLVFAVSRFLRLFPKYRVLHSGVSESPAFIAGLALFLFVLTAFVMTEVAG